MVVEGRTWGKERDELAMPILYPFTVPNHWFLVEIIPEIAEVAVLCEAKARGVRIQNGRWWTPEKLGLTYLQYSLNCKEIKLFW